MNTTPGNDDAMRGHGEDGKAEQPEAKCIRKIDRIVEALKQPCGLNRFDAERIGDHAPNSTVAIVRKRHGDKLRQEWETVPTRFNPAGVRVYRYWLVEGAQ